MTKARRVIRERLGKLSIVVAGLQTGSEENSSKMLMQEATTIARLLCASIVIPLLYRGFNIFRSIV